jgi:hypothetical protein
MNGAQMGRVFSALTLWGLRRKLLPQLVLAEGDRDRPAFSSLSFHALYWDGELARFVCIQAPTQIAQKNSIMIIFYPIANPRRQSSEVSFRLKCLAQKRPTKQG